VKVMKVDYVKPAIAEADIHSKSFNMKLCPVLYLLKYLEL
jgi:hypothetical protein